MSSEAVWFFLKGQETVGPFSVDALRQMHAGGEFQPDSMVWREGMEAWQPASAVAELGIFAAAPVADPPPVQSPTEPAPPAAEPAAPAAAPASKFKLRLKTVSAGAPAAPPPSTLPPLGAAPSPSVGSMSPVTRGMPGPASPTTAGPGLAPSTGPIGGPKAFLLDTDGQEVVKKPPLPKWKKMLLRVFSSLVWVPAFMIACGGIVWFFQIRFPNVLWFVYLAAGFGAVAVLPLVGFRWFDRAIRFLAILFLLPPILLLWPIVTRGGIKEVPGPYWWFVGYCFLYGLTIRLGFRDFLSWGLAGFLCLTGLGVVGFEIAVARDIWTPPGWDRLIEKGSTVKLPAALVRMASLPPHLASTNGKLTFGVPPTASVHPVERGVVKQVEGKDWQLFVQLVDGQVFGANLVLGSGAEFDSKKVVNFDWPAIFSKDESQELQAPSTKWKMLDGKTVDVGGATVNVVLIRDRHWVGSLKFYSSADKAAGKGEPDAGRGEFEFDVEMR